MRKDIKILPVENVTMAITRQKSVQGDFEWSVYLLNQNKFGIENVLITSKGYGHQNGEEQKTSTLRHMFEYIGPKSHVLVEPIIPDLFHLSNEYWVSYYLDKEILDKKFIFVPDSITEENIQNIETLNMEGVLHG